MEDNRSFMLGYIQKIGVKQNSSSKSLSGKAEALENIISLRNKSW